MENDQVQKRDFGLDNFFGLDLTSFLVAMSTF